MPLKSVEEITEKLLEIQTALMGLALQPDNADTKRARLGLETEARVLLWAIGRVDWEGNKTKAG